MQFMARIEMHHATDEMYATLHSRMEAASFSRFVIDSVSGKKHHMPTGAYWTESYANSQQVITTAIQAATEVDPNVSIVVSGGNEPIRFYNLPPVETTLRDMGHMLALLGQPKPEDSFDLISAWSRSVVPVPETVGLSFWEGMLKAK